MSICNMCHFYICFFASTEEFHGRTYINNEEVQPAPGICEIFGKSIRHPLQQHLQNEDVGEDFVCKLQYRFNGLPLLNVDVFKCLDVNAVRVRNQLLIK